jgi:ribosomal protein S18 acetylase RimI-like enzyme
MIEYIKNDHKEIPPEKQLDTAQIWLREGEAWKDKFVNKDIVIELVRRQNIKEIPVMNKAKHYDCNNCMYYMMNDRGNRTAKDKKGWFQKMLDKYKLSCGMILYYKGKPVGFTQYAPKKEFIKLEDFSKNSTNTDVWYISCIAIKKRYQGKGFGSILLKKVLNYLKENGVKAVQACGQIKGDANNVSGGYWSMYEKFGFRKISEDSGFAVGELKLK